MMRAVTRALILGGLVTALSGTASVAHHFMGEYDLQRQHEIKGVVKDFQWTNPHVWLILMAKDSKGKVKQWAFQGAEPSSFKKVGMTRSSVVAGDTVTVRYAPRLDGLPEGRLSAILTINGKPGPGATQKEGEKIR